MHKVLLVLIGFIITSCGILDNSPTGNDSITAPSNNIVQNCVTNTGDASVTGNLILVSANTPLTDNSFTIVSITDMYSATTTLGTSCTTGIQSNPFAYQVYYNTQDVYANTSYSVSVNIYEKFNGVDYYVRDTSTFIYPVITNGNGTIVDIYAYSIAFIN